MILFVLLFLSFVLSGSEVAFFSLTYKDINLLKSKQQPPYQRIVDLLEQPKTLLASMLIANCFINIAIIIISNLLIDDMFNFEKFDAVWVEFLIKVVAVSFILVLFGEVMPKVAESLAKQYPFCQRLSYRRTGRIVCIRGAEQRPGKIFRYH